MIDPVAYLRASPKYTITLMRHLGFQVLDVLSDLVFGEGKSVSKRPVFNMHIVDIFVRHEEMLRGLLRVSALEHTNNDSIPISSRDGNSWR